VVLPFRLSNLPWGELALTELDKKEDLIQSQVDLASPFPRVDKKDTMEDSVPQSGHRGYGGGQGGQSASIAQGGSVPQSVYRRYGKQQSEIKMSHLPVVDRFKRYGR